MHACRAAGSVSCPPMSNRLGGRSGFIVAVAAVWLAVAPHAASAQAGEPIQPASALKKLSLEELFALQVTTVSQKPESLSKAAAAIHVVTQDDIRRVGALSIP